MQDQGFKHRPPQKEKYKVFRCAPNISNSIPLKKKKKNISNSQFAAFLDSPSIKLFEF
jgi:hypothetical protein